MPRGPTPRDVSARRNPRQPIVHEWQPTTGTGWQHSETHPPAPDKLLKPSKEAWTVWMGSWFASHWGPEDLPALRQLIRLYDQVERGEFQRHGELRIAMDTFGITPKGQQDRRWQPPKAAETPEVAVGEGRPSRYGQLRAVPE